MQNFKPHAQIKNSIFSSMLDH